MKPKTLALAILAALAWLLFPGCAADGSSDAQGFNSAVRTGMDAYDRYNGRYYFDRPIYPPGSPFPVYPTSP